MTWFKTYRKDLILILGILIGAGLLAGAFALAKKPGAYVRVEQSGKTIGIYPLTEDRREVFPAESREVPEEEGNVLIIENGTVRMEEASCPDKLCVKQGTKSKAGETIVCLPHRLVVTVISEGEAKELMP